MLFMKAFYLKASSPNQGGFHIRGRMHMSRGGIIIYIPKGPFHLFNKLKKKKCKIQYLNFVFILNLKTKLQNVQTLHKK